MIPNEESPSPGFRRRSNEIRCLCIFPQPRVTYKDLGNDCNRRLILIEVNYPEKDDHMIHDMYLVCIS